MEESEGVGGEGTCGILRWHVAASYWGSFEASVTFRVERSLTAPSDARQNPNAAVAWGPISR